MLFETIPGAKSKIPTQWTQSLGSLFVDLPDQWDDFMEFAPRCRKAGSQHKGADLGFVLGCVGTRPNRCLRARRVPAESFLSEDVDRSSEAR